MHILFITNNFPPIVDGVGDYTFHLAQEFVKNGHKVLVVCKANAQIPQKVSGIEVKAIIKSWNKKAAIPIISLIEDYKISWVILQYVPHGFQRKGLPFALISVMKQIKSTGVKTMVFCHEISISYVERKNLKRFLIYKMMRYIIKRILINADVVTTSIDYYYRILRQLVPEIICHHPIPIAANIPYTSKTGEELHRLRKEIAPQNEIIISFFGKRSIKNSITAIRNLIKEGMRIKVLFIGNALQDISELNSSNYYKTGILDLQQLDPYLLISDILVLPEAKLSGCSFKSGSLSAALRDGVTVLSSTGFLTSEELIDRQNIIFTDFESVSDIENKLRLLISNSSLRKKIGRQAQITVKSHSWENTYKAYMYALQMKELF